VIHLLYVDDEPALLEVGKVFLERSRDITCDTALSARSALGKMKDTPYDAVVSDFQMPGMDGIEILKYVRKKCGDIPFIIFTGRGREEVVIQALNNGADFYIQKGGDPVAQFRELEHKVRQAVNRHRAEEKIRRISRFNRVTVQVNSGLFQYREKDAFLAYACSVLAREGGYVVAWVGIIDPSSGQVIPVAGEGPAGALPPETLDQVAGSDLSASPAFRKIRAGRAVYVTAEKEPLFLPRQEEGAESRSPFHAALLPLFEKGEVTGLLCLWSDRKEAFPPEEKEFFEAISSDISTALERMDAEEMRARAEEALAEAHQQMADIIEFLPDPTFAIDRNGRVIAWNRAIEEMTGVRKNAVIGRGDFIYAEAIYGERRPIFIDLVLGDHPETEKEYPGMRRQGAILEAEVFRPTLRGGRGAFLRLKAAPLLDRKGRPAGAIETIQDITVLKETERNLLAKNEELSASLEEITAMEAALRQQVEQIAESEEHLRESEARYRAIFENTGTATVLVGKDGTIVLANSEFERLSGYPRGEIENRKTWMEFVVREDLERMLAQHRLRREDREKALRRYTFRFVTRSGDIRRIDLTVDMVPGTMQSVTSLRDITEEKEREEELRALSDEYTHILENISDVYYRSDARGNLVKASRSFATLLGYGDLSECLGKNIAREFYMNPDDRKRLLDELYREGRVTDYEVTLRRKDGTPVIVSSRSYLVRDASGAVAGVEGTFRDVTLQKQMLAEIRESEQRLHDIIDFLPDATFVIDRDGTVIAWNRAIEEMTGVPASRMVGRGNHEYALPFYGERRPILIDLVLVWNEEIQKKYSYVTAEGDTLTAETIHARPQGKEAILWGKARPLYNQQGEIVGAIESIRDVTRQRQAERELKEAYARLAEVHRVARIGVWEWSPATDTIRWSEELCRMIGWDPSVPPPRFAELEQYFTQESWDIFARAKEKALEEKKLADLELEVIPPDGNRRWLFLSGGVACDAEGHVVRIHGTIQDITGRKEMEAALRESEERFRTANRKLSLLSAITRHDISNQLIVAMGFLDFVREKVADPGEREYISKVAAALERITRMIRFMKEYETLGVQAPVWFDCRAGVEKVAGEVPTGNVRVENEIPPGVEIRADPLVEKVFFNLVQNAVSHGGKVTTVRFSFGKSDGNAIIACEDDGVGIAPGEKEKIFDRGYGKNSGLGLFLSREILSISGISIRETGVFGEGARFEILVPAGSYRRKEG